MCWTPCGVPCADGDSPHNVFLRSTAYDDCENPFLPVTPAAHQKVLIVAQDPVLAALVGSAVELGRFTVAFPKANERPDEALTRVKPLIAILIDGAADEAQSDIFLARARKKGVHVLVFGGAATAVARRPWAAARNVPVFTLPDELPALGHALEEIGASARSGKRRFERRGRTKITGPLVLHDRSGKRWSVYDRRSEDRRQHVIDREFVSETGEVRHCHLDADEATDTSPSTLMNQLERSPAE